MRPYMLWLTRVYGQGRGTLPMLAEQWPNVVSDWARRLREHEFERGFWPQPETERPYWYIDRATRKRMTLGSQRPGALRRAYRGRARGAVQGER